MSDSIAQRKEVLGEIRILQRVGVLAFLTLLSSCASNVWLTDAAISARKKSPEELIRQLGPPAKIVYNQRLPLYNGENQEYRYFVINRSGKAEVRQYFYNGAKYLTEMFPPSETEKGDHFKIIDPTSASYRAPLERLWKAWPELRP